MRTSEQSFLLDGGAKRPPQSIQWVNDLLPHESATLDVKYL